MLGLGATNIRIWASRFLIYGSVKRRCTVRGNHPSRRVSGVSLQLRASIRRMGMRALPCACAHTYTAPSKALMRECPALGSSCEQSDPDSVLGLHPLQPLDGPRPAGPPRLSAVREQTCQAEAAASSRVVPLHLLPRSDGSVRHLCSRGVKRMALSVAVRPRSTPSTPLVPTVPARLARIR
jgi:hypothetical protein